MTKVHLLERRPQQAPESAAGAPLLLMLHGYGSNEYDLFELANLLDPRLHIVSLRAPINVGFGFAWYQLYGTPGNLIPDPATRTQAIGTLQHCVAEIPPHVQTDPRRTYLFGFSQGAALSLALALHAPDRVAGVIAISGYLDPETTAGADPSVLQGREILMIHGMYDDVIPVEAARQSRVYLEQHAARLQYHENPIGHSIHPEGLAVMQRWISERLDASAQLDSLERQA
jgi:phospholipase/carboxylesterase